jgi:hypothetical protein
MGKEKKMGNTVRLSSIAPIAQGKRLADAQAGRITMAQYLVEMCAAQGASFGWQPNGEYLLDFGKGILDPSGQPLDIHEVLEVAKAMMPSPLRSAGNVLRLRGPMPGAVAALITRVCYAAQVVVEILDRNTGMVIEVPIAKLERDGVRLITPDTAESWRDIGNGWVMARTSQLSYRRRKSAPAFGYQSRLDLVFIETNAAHQKAPRAQVTDGTYFAWVDDLRHLEDVV